MSERASLRMLNSTALSRILLVPEERLELSRGYPHRILSPARLPFHHSGTGDNINNEAAIGIQEDRSIRISPATDQKLAKDWLSRHPLQNLQQR
jgi:hypothetical protein